MINNFDLCEYKENIMVVPDKYSPIQNKIRCKKLNVNLWECPKDCEHFKPINFPKNLTRKYKN